MANFQETKFYQKLQQLKKDMAPMSFAQKVDHLWYYYKTYIFVFTVLAVAVIAILGSTLSKKESMEKAFVDMKITAEDIEVKEELLVYTVNGDVTFETEAKTFHVVVLRLAHG